MEEADFAPRTVAVMAGALACSRNTEVMGHTLWRAEVWTRQILCLRDLGEQARGGPDCPSLTAFLGETSNISILCKPLPVWSSVPCGRASSQWVQHITWHCHYWQDYSIKIETSRAKEGNYSVFFTPYSSPSTSQAVPGVHVTSTQASLESFIQGPGRGVFSPLCRKQTAFDDKDVFLINQLSKKCEHSQLLHQGAISSL